MWAQASTRFWSLWSPPSSETPVCLGGVPESSCTPGLGKQVDVSVHSLCVYVFACAHMCRVYVGGRALGVLDDRFVSELVSKTFLGQGRLLFENQPAGHRTVSSLAQLYLVSRGQRTAGLYV